MAEYSSNDVAQWLKGAFAVNRKRGHELQFDCPLCSHASFYFNVSKQIGFCHRATCRTTFTLDRMIDEVGYPPELAGYGPLVSTVKSIPSSPVELPKSAVQIQRDDPAVEALATRGVTYDHIVQFQIRCDNKRLYVPVYEGGELRQFNSRRIDTRKAPKDWFKAGDNPYRYASGHPITHYFLGWEECRMWSDIVLVENTFVSMWLRDLHATATFGSHLSDTQIDKLVHSKIKHVTFLWDGGTALATEKASKRLKWRGIQSSVITLPGKAQPDDYAKADIEEML